MVSERLPVVAVVGAGPGGLAASAALKREGVAFDLYDKEGVVGGAYTKMYAKLTLASPARYNGLPGLPVNHTREYITAGEYSGYLERYARQHGLTVIRATVVKVEPEYSSFRVSFSETKGAKSYGAIVVATGMFDFPLRPKIRELADPSPADLRILHSREWNGPRDFAGKKILIVGAGMSAVEIAEEFAGNGSEVTMSIRGKTVRLLPQRVFGRDLHDLFTLFKHFPARWFGWHCRIGLRYPAINRRFRHFVAEGKISICGELTAFEGNRAVFVGGGKKEFDGVVFATGYQYQAPFLPEALMARQGKGYLPLSGGESPMWPGLYFIGRPCAATVSSEFLWGIAGDALRIAQRIKRAVAG